jgi:hypothetical protein
VTQQTIDMFFRLATLLVIGTLILLAGTLDTEHSTRITLQGFGVVVLVVYGARRGTGVVPLLIGCLAAGLVGCASIPTPQHQLTTLAVESGDRGSQWTTARSCWAVPPWSVCLTVDGDATEPGSTVGSCLLLRPLDGEPGQGVEVCSEDLGINSDRPGGPQIDSSVR